MRIALIRQRYAAGGGAEGYVAQLLESLSAAGHEVHLFAHRWTGVPAGVTIHRVPVVPAPAFLRVLSFAWAARRMTRRGDFDLVQSFDRTLSPDLYRAGDGCHRAWLDRRRAVEGNPLRLLDGVNPMHRSLLFLERRLFQGGCRCVIANSRMVQEEILRYYGAPGARDPGSLHRCGPFALPPGPLARGTGGSAARAGDRHGRSRWCSSRAAASSGRDFDSCWRR